MSFLISDRVKETSTTTGTGTITLAGAVSGFDSFGAGIGDGNSTYYCISHKTLAEWEVGIGTYTASGTTLSRTTVLSSSNADAAVNFSAGDKDVFCTAPAGKLFTEGTVHAAASKTTPVDADELSILDSAASYVIKRLTWANLKATLKSYFDTLYASLAGATFTGPINEARGTVTMHATTMDLWAQPNTIDGTGSAVTITAIANAPQAGAKRTLYPVAGTVITNGATFSVDGAANYTTAAGDALEFEAVTTSTYKVHITKADGTAVASSAFTDKIQPITASVATNALTLKLNPTTLDFRSATLSSGTVNTRTVPALISCVVPSTATLGTVDAVKSRLVVLAIDNAGTVELAVVNIAGGNDLSESGVISTTALSTASDSATVIYSTTARTNVPYRVVGYVESTQATAGTWATAPSMVQGCGGQAFATIRSLGYGQAYSTSVIRTSGTTYYNMSGKPQYFILESFGGSAGHSITTLSINGGTPFKVMYFYNAVSNYSGVGSCIIPAGASYVFVDTNNPTRLNHLLG